MQECTFADRDSQVAPGTTYKILNQLLPDITESAHPRDLSEGQRLSLVLAIVLAASPKLLILDEPTRGLDYSAKLRLIKILRAMAAEGRSVILATHDVELVAEVANRVIFLAEGEKSPMEVRLKSSLHHQHLLRKSQNFSSRKMVNLFRDYFRS